MAQLKCMEMTLNYNQGFFTIDHKRQLIRSILIANLHFDVLEGLRQILVKLLLGLNDFNDIPLALDLMCGLSMSSQVDFALKSFLAEAAAEWLVASVLSHVSDSVDDKKREEKFRLIYFQMF